MFHVATPSIKVYVQEYYLTRQVSTKLIPGYLSSVKSVDGNCLMFSVYLETGAMFSNLPIEAIFCDRYYSIDVDSALSTDELQPYSCLDGAICVLEIPLLRHCPVKTKLGHGTYLFTIDYNGTGLADDPEQRKTHNIIVLKSGQLCALPNNYCLFINDSLTNNKELDYPNYKRSDRYYTPGS